MEEDMEQYSDKSSSYYKESPNSNGNKSENTIEIKETDMEPAMVDCCVNLIRQGQRDLQLDKDVASYVKDECERRFGGTWHCICGKSFGSRVSYEMHHFLLVKMNRVSVMVFKCGY